MPRPRSADPKARRRRAPPSDPCARSSRGRGPPSERRARRASTGRAASSRRSRRRRARGPRAARARRLSRTGRSSPESLPRSRQCYKALVMSIAAELPLQALERLVERATGTPAPLRVDEILGGASVRRFLRVPTHDGGTVVAMFVPLQSHEFEKKNQQDGRRWPFLEVRDLLAAHGVRVPRLIAEACEDGLLLVEDLGETLAQHLVHSPGDREPLYRLAVRDLSRARRELRELPAGSVVRDRAFDRELLSWELEHFRAWALEARGIELCAEDRATFDTAAEYLTATISGLPRGFVHRDYQSRNLMVVREPGGTTSLGWIDFQDALLGPRVYDLVALLGDSYQAFTPDFVSARLADFSDGLGLSDRKRVV